MRISRSFTTVTLIAASTFVLAACAADTGPTNSDSGAPRGFMTLADTQAEYDDTVAGFPYDLPDGVTFPAQVQQPTQATIYQEGAGLVQAYQFWECAWMDRALAAHGTDQTAFDVALAQLEEGTSSIYRTQYMIDDDDNWGGIALAQAALGDSTVLGEFFRADCIWYQTEIGQ